ncbi:DUF4286 family protein [Ascidiimonas sp. W6]|uniref:DUF4286 family protein n=1 Tax=Ascidiimonas meishanensis TaxID=3128903 RepID=UPI0030ED144D
MYIYNVTVNIDESSHNEWIQWMEKSHIPDMLATGKFTSARMLKVLVEEEMGGITYSVQYYTESKEMLQQYYAEDAARLRQDALRKFADKFVAFRTELELLNEYNND